VDAVETLTHYDLFSSVSPTIQHCIQAGVNGVNPQSQVISFLPIPTHHFGDADFLVDATASSGLPVTLTVVSGPASVLNGHVHVTGVGTVTIRASQAGNLGSAGVPVTETFAAAVPVDQTFGVDRAIPVFSGLDSPTVEAGVAAVSVSGTLSAGAVVPAGSVTVTLQGTTVAAAIGPDGRFTASFPSLTFTVAGGPYPIGFAYAGDALFAPATGSSAVTAADTTPPAVGAVTASPNIVIVPDHKLFGVSVDYSASDFSGAPVCSLSVSSNEAVDGLGDGHTTTDWLVIDPHHVQLRAERAGTGSGRVYTIIATCRDAFGNASSQQTTVSIPK
jgi:hypothetical protein